MFRVAQRDTQTTNPVTITVNTKEFVSQVANGAIGLGFTEICSAAISVQTCIMVSPPQTSGERSAGSGGEHRTDRASGRRVGLGIKATANASGKLFVKFFTRHFLLRKSLFPDTYFSTPIPFRILIGAPLLSGIEINSAPTSLPF